LYLWIEGNILLVVFYEGDKVEIGMDLDMYQMLDLCRDAKAKLRKKEFEVPEYAGFIFSPPLIGCRKKLSFSCDNDWLNLVNLWDYVVHHIPIYMLT